MFDIVRKEIEWGGRKLTLETGHIARQADGAVLVSYGESSVLCTAVGEHSPREGLDFFPLTVHYQEKTYAAGKIPGGFFKREGRPTEKEVLTSRLIDRPIRPLFHKSYRNETQVICTTVSHDLENDPDIAALIGASAALTISGMPFMGPIGAARVGYIDGEYVLNPTADQIAESALDLVVAGTNEGVLMVESQANELTEEVMLGAVMFGHEAYQDVINAIIDLAERAAKEPRPVEDTPQEVLDLEAKVRELGEAGITFREIVRRTRFAVARRLLVRTDESIDHIAFHAGFSQRSAFCRAFGEWTGMSPTCYRERHRVPSQQRRTVQQVLQSLARAA